MKSGVDDRDRTDSVGAFLLAPQKTDNRDDDRARNG